MSPIFYEVVVFCEEGSLTEAIDSGLQYCGADGAPHIHTPWGALMLRFPLEDMPEVDEIVRAECKEQDPGEDFE